MKNRLVFKKNWEFPEISDVFRHALQRKRGSTTFYNTISVKNLSNVNLLLITTMLALQYFEENFKNG